MSDIDTRSYRPQDKLLYSMMLIWIVAWGLVLITSPFEYPDMVFRIPVSLGIFVVALQVLVPKLRFSGLANMIAFFVLIATVGLGLILRAV